MKKQLLFDQLESKIAPGGLIPPTTNEVPVYGIILVLDYGGNSPPPGNPPIIHPAPLPIGPAGPALQIDYSDGLLLALDSGG